MSSSSVILSFLGLVFVAVFAALDAAFNLPCSLLDVDLGSIFTHGSLIIVDVLGCDIKSDSESVIDSYVISFAVVGFDVVTGGIKIGAAGDFWVCDTILILLLLNGV